MEASHFEVNVCLDELYNFDIGLKILHKLQKLFTFKAKFSKKQFF